jgi:hypothetical protein
MELLGEIFTVFGYTFPTGGLGVELSVKKAVSKRIVLRDFLTTQEIHTNQVIDCPKETNPKEFIDLFNKNLSNAILMNEEDWEFEVFGLRFFKPSSNAKITISEGYKNQIVINRCCEKPILLRRALDLPPKVSQNKFISEFKKEYSKALEKQKICH